MNLISSLVRSTQTVTRNAMKLPAVYAYKRTSDQGKELRYSIRSLSNLTNWNGQVFVIGDSEAWFSQKIQLIEAPKSADKYADSQGKLLAATQHKRIPDNFIYMNDDFYITTSTEASPLYDGKLIATNNKNRWQQTKANTKAYLEQQGIQEPLDYDIHTPIVFNKQDLAAALAICNEQPNLQIRSLYGNLYKVGGKQYADKKTSTFKLPKAKYISTRMFSPELQKLFPNKSEFEL